LDRLLLIGLIYFLLYEAFITYDLLTRLYTLFFELDPLSYDFDCFIL